MGISFLHQDDEKVFWVSISSESQILEGIWGPSLLPPTSTAEVLEENHRTSLSKSVEH